MKIVKRWEWIAAAVWAILLIVGFFYMSAAVRQKLNPPPHAPAQAVNLVQPAAGSVLDDRTPSMSNDQPQVPLAQNAGPQPETLKAQPAGASNPASIKAQPAAEPGTAALKAQPVQDNQPEPAKAQPAQDIQQEPVNDQPAVSPLPDKTQSPPGPAAETPQPAAAPQKVFYRNKVAVITYHHLDAKESSVTITPERFVSHLKALKQNGFQVISVEDFVSFLQKKKTVPPNAVVITFDDGYESVYKYAYPALKAENMPATVFLIVGYVEDGTARTPAILNWKQIGEMHKDGISFYSHSYNSHDSIIDNGKEYSLLTTKLKKQPDGTLESDSEYSARVQSDLTKADDILNAKLGNQMNLLCLPHGQYNQTVLDIAQQTNIPYLFTGKEGFNTDSTKLINRFNAGSPYMTDKLLIHRLATPGK